MKTLLLSLSLILIFASQAFAQSLTLNWQDNSNNETGFNVARKTLQTGAFNSVGQTATDVTTFIDAIPDGQLYCYRVNAFNGAGVSPWSSEPCGTTLTTPLSPTTVTITITVTP